MSGMNPYKSKQPPRSRIMWAVESTPSMLSAARALNMSYNTFRKYAIMYGVFKPNPHGQGIRQSKLTRLSKIKLADILDGKYPMLPQIDIMSKLLKSGLKSQECEICGYNSYRPTDMSSPLVLDFLDGDIHNHALNNLRLICYNCFYITHAMEPPKNIPVIRIGDFKRKIITAFDDIDIKQDENSFSVDAGTE